MEAYLSSFMSAIRGSQKGCETFPLVVINPNQYNPVSEKSKATHFYVLKQKLGQSDLLTVETNNNKT